jgi:hypothetical protein
MRAILFCLALVPALVAGCDTGTYHPPGAGGGSTSFGPPRPSDSTAGAPDNTFDHDNDAIDPFELLSRLQREGPIEVSSRLHSCQKLTFRALAYLLASRGVDLSAPGANGIPSAGELFRTGAQALGAANFDARVAEAVEPTAAGMTRLYDIFVQAAPQIIANLPNMPACQVRGEGAQLFDGAGACQQAGVTCLLGFPATAEHLALCNQIIGQASSPALGRVIAVAALLSAAHSCE